MSLYRDEAIVLRTYKLGEADRIVVLLTAANGQVRGVAKGVRKSRSRFGSRLEPTGHVAVQLYRGRGELHTITQVERLDLFAALRGDLERVGVAVSMLEVAEQLSVQDDPDPALFRMLLGALRTLDARPHPLVGPAFFLKALALAGLGPEVHSCVACGAGPPLVAFDHASGGLLCGDCRQGRAVSAEAVRVLQAVLGGGLATVLDAEPSPASGEIAALAAESMEHHLERRVRSLGVLPAGSA